MYKKLLLKAIKYLQKNAKVLTSSIPALLLIISPAYATQPKLVSGTVSLFQAISGWLLLIIPVGAGAVLSYHALQKSLSDDQAVIAEKNKQMKNVLISAAIATTASGLVNIILGYYK